MSPAGSAQDKIQDARQNPSLKRTREDLDQPKTMFCLVEGCSMSYKIPQPLVNHMQARNRHPEEVLSVPASCHHKTHKAATRFSTFDESLQHMVYKHMRIKNPRSNESPITPTEYFETIIPASSHLITPDNKFIENDKYTANAILDDVFEDLSNQIPLSYEHYTETGPAYQNSYGDGTGGYIQSSQTGYNGLLHPYYQNQLNNSLAQGEDHEHNIPPQ
jgi:hypothetical protein